MGGGAREPSHGTVTEAPPAHRRGGATRRRAGVLRAARTVAALLAVAGFVLAGVLVTAAAEASPATTAAAGPTTTALADAVVVQGLDVTLTYRVDDATAEKAAVTVVVTDAAGATVYSDSPAARVPTNQDLSYTFTCALAPADYRFHVEAVDGHGLPQTAATDALLRVAPVFPLKTSVAEAVAWLKQRKAAAGLAVIDDTGRVYGCNLNGTFPSASVVKTMLLVRYLRTHAVLSDARRQQLQRMIIISDNEAATAIYKLVRARGVRDVAALAGMTHFTIGRDWWMAGISALDQARLFSTMDSLVPAQYRDWVRYLFSHITPEHKWGVPEVAEPLGWRVFFKGGYMPVGGGNVVHEACRLERRGVVFTLVILTGGPESEGYGIKTLRGVTQRVLGLLPVAPASVTTGGGG